MESDHDYLSMALMNPKQMDKGISRQQPIKYWAHKKGNIEKS